MSELSRRDLLQSIALSVTLGGLSPAAAQHVHSLAAEEKTSTGVYKAKALNPHEYHTLEKLADLIVPADDKSPGAVASGACEFIDLLASQNPKLLEIYTGGIAWLDQAMRRRYSTDFVSAKPNQQTALLDLIAYRKNESSELGPGILFFDWARRMVVDAYYTSPTGIKTVGYLGNTSVSKFEIPQEAIDYAVKRNPA
jgi:gluconate 2-dehydrogenase gamma chain